MSLISHLINRSLSTVVVPQNLPFAKVLEKVAASQLQSHLELDNLYETLQSGFRPLHCTETALLRLVTDLLLSADSEFLIFLLLLDLSSAFATIPKLSLSVFLPWALLSCFTSYLSDKQYFIILQRYKSPILPLLMVFLKVLFSVLCSLSSSFLWYYPVTIWVSKFMTHTHTHIKSSSISLLTHFDYLWSKNLNELKQNTDIKPKSD